MKLPLGSQALFDWPFGFFLSTSSHVNFPTVSMPFLSSPARSRRDRWEFVPFLELPRPSASLYNVGGPAWPSLAILPEPFPSLARSHLPSAPHLISSLSLSFCMQEFFISGILSRNITCGFLGSRVLLCICPPHPTGRNSTTFRSTHKLC